MKRPWKPFVDRRRAMENTPEKSAVSYCKGSSACLLAVLLLLAAAAAAEAGEPKFKEPRTVYLAMGDSLAFGFQEAKLLAGLPNPSPSLFNTGYVDDFAADFGGTYPGVETVNPYSEIIVVGLYDVLYPAIFLQTLAQTGSPVAAAAAGAQAEEGDESDDDTQNRDT